MRSLDKGLTSHRGAFFMLLCWGHVAVIAGTVPSWCMTLVSTEAALSNAATLSSPPEQDPGALHFSAMADRVTVTKGLDPRPLLVEWAQPIKEHFEQAILSRQQTTLWLKGERGLYQASVSLKGGGIRIDRLQPISPIYQEPCTWRNRWALPLDGGCQLTSYVYSKFLDRAYLSGFKTSWWHEERILIEARPGTAPRLLQGQQSFLEDLMAQGGVVLVGSDRKPVFYDGQRFKPLMPDTWHPLPGSTMPGIAAFGWTLRDVQLTSRYVITSVRHVGVNVEPLLLEVGPKGSTRSIQLDQSMFVGTDFFSLSEDAPLMRVLSDGVYADLSGKWTRVITPKPGWHFERPYIAAVSPSRQPPLPAHLLAVQGARQELYLVRAKTGTAPCP